MRVRNGARVRPHFAIVVPTVGRPSLWALLDSLLAQDGPQPDEVVVVDDRPRPEPPLHVDLGDGPPARVVHGFGRGPAAARNLGASLVQAPWVAFLDDDVLVPPDWSRRLVADLEALDAGVAGSQGRIRVPLPDHRRPTDWERSTAGLESAVWATADMAYRTEALRSVHGFDERFPRAYREDADLALRLRRAGWELVRGSREVTHPVRPAPWHQSLRSQRGNADDALMRRLHGPDWREAAQTGNGRLPWHVATTAAAFGTVVGAAGSRALSEPSGIRPRMGVFAGACALTWAALTAEFAVRRIAAGPRSPRESAAMLLTSALIPPVAVAHRLLGAWRHRRAAAWPPPVRAVLFDRDGTLVHDVPYNGDPELVSPVPSAREALDRLRRRGIPIGVVSNQSGVARGLVTEKDVRSVNAEIERRLGPVDTWQVCTHGPDDGCSCRKPAPGLIHAAARALGVPVDQCLVVGDIESDVDAARRAGAAAVLVPTPETRPEELARASHVAADLNAAVDEALARSEPRSEPRSGDRAVVR